MNNQKAKKIRRAAEAVTVGRPYREYSEAVPPTFAEKPTYPGGPLRFVKVSKGIPTRLNPSCTRALYRRVKRNINVAGVLA